MTHTILATGIPTLVVIVGILLNRNDANSIRAELHTVRNELKADISALGRDLREEIASLRKQSHNDVLM